MKNTTKVRWGLLSTANINRRLIPAIRASKRGELVAVASRSLPTANKYATKWNIPLVFSSYQEMLESDKIDVVYVSLPNHLHAEWSVRAMQAGVHVLCEKPFAITQQQVEQMIETSRQTGKVLAEAFMYHHHPQTKIVGEWVRSGRLGEISMVSGVFNFKIKDRKDVRLVPEYGGGCLWDVGIYPLSFAQFVFGEAPSTVFGMQWIGDTGVDEIFAGQMCYPGNRLAQIASSFRTEFHINMEIIGTEGRLSLSRPFSAMDDNRHLVFYPDQGKAKEIPVPEQELYIGEVEDMHDAILEKTPSYLSLQETHNHIRTTLALYDSARCGKLVSL